MNLLPQPKTIELKEGQFNIDQRTKIALIRSEETVDYKSAKHLQNQMGLILGYTPSITSTMDFYQGNIIYLQISEINEEAYEIEIHDNQIVIRGGSQKGVYYGIHSLTQIMLNYKMSIPCLMIKDEPQFKNRGFYHDITRGEIPKIETLKQLVDIASFYKLNQFQLYFEHTFAFSHFSEIWSDVDPLTAEDILILDDYCKEKHIELVPSLSTFGHLYRILSTKSHSKLCELENSDDFEFSFIDRQLHHTLDVTNEDSILFVRKMIDEFLPLFSSNQFNICADETFDLGKGKSQSFASTLGIGKIYVDFLNKIINIVKGYGKKVMVWGDIISKHQEYIKEIDEDVIFLHWDYAKEPREQVVKLFSNSNHPYYVCPAVWGWNRLTPNIPVSHQNIVTMAQYGVKYQANGLLNTNWGDFGHLNYFSMLVPGLVYGAAYSWNPNEDQEQKAINQKISMIHYQDHDKKLINYLVEVNQRHYMTFRELIYFLEKQESKFFDQTTDEQEIIKANKRIDEIIKIYFSYLPKVTTDKRIDIEEYISSAKGVQLFNRLLIVMRKYELGLEVESHVDLKRLANQFEVWFNEYSRIWRVRNKESELHRLKDVFTKVSRLCREYETK